MSTLLNITPNCPVALTIDIAVGCDIDFQLKNTDETDWNDFWLQADVCDLDGNLLFSVSSDAELVVDDDDTQLVTMSWSKAMTELLSPDTEYMFDVLAIPDVDPSKVYLFWPKTTFRTIQRVTTPE